MVGHTGVIAAVVKAVEAVDACLGQVIESVRGAGGVCLVCADHGNAEQLLEDGRPEPAHGAHDESRAARRHVGGPRPP